MSPPTSGTLKVEIDASSATGYVLADGVRIVETSPAAYVAYNAAGLVTSETNALGQTTSYGYDALLRRTSITDANGDATLLGYDTLGRNTTVTDPEGNVTTFVYDDLGRVVEEKVTIGGSVLSRQFEYDLRGNRTRGLRRQCMLRRGDFRVSDTGALVATSRLRTTCVSPPKSRNSPR